MTKIKTLAKNTGSDSLPVFFASVLILSVCLSCVCISVFSLFWFVLFVCDAIEFFSINKVDY